MALVAALLFTGCGKSGGPGGAGDPGPAFHSISIVASPLPTAPVTLSGLPLLNQVDCYPNSTVQVYGIDVYFAPGASGSASNTNNMQWSSSATNVATVSGGLVSCKTAGTAQIQGSIPGETCDANGTPCTTAPLIVTVGSAKHTLALSPTSVSLNSGQSQQMTVSLITETAPGSSTTQDVTAAVFTTPGQPSTLILGGGNAPPVDFNASQNGNLVAQGSASAFLFVSYPSGSPGFDYMSNFVLFTSK